MNLLITGGAGYIGAHLHERFVTRGFRTVLLDNMSAGRAEAVRGADLVRADVRDRHALDAVFRERRIDAVVHLAGVDHDPYGDEDPGPCWWNNTVGTLTLLDAMRTAGVRRFVYASSSDVYGLPLHTPIDEEHVKAPLSAYGMSRWAVEQILEQYRVAHGLRAVALRYFEVAGLRVPGTSPGTRAARGLVSLAARAASRRSPAVRIDGIDHPTRDGTVVRDIVHVGDLCEAHVLAVEALLAGRAAPAYNLGTGTGVSLREVIVAMERLSRRDVPVRVGRRRAQEPAVLIADASAARRDLQWRPRASGLDTMVAEAWAHEQSLTPKAQLAFAT